MQNSRRRRSPAARRKRVAPTGNTQTRGGRRKEVNIGAVGMGLIGSAPQKPWGYSSRGAGAAFSSSRLSLDTTLCTEQKLSKAFLAFLWNFLSSVGFIFARFSSDTSKPIRLRLSWISLIVISLFVIFIISFPLL